MADRFLQLADDLARDPAVAGGKAAGLARAFVAGFPVLPGWVLPIHESAEVLRMGGSMLRRSGPAAACLAVADHPLDASLMRELGRLAERLGTSAIVRSSTLQDVDPAWAGAFATYADVSPDTLPIAIRGCWASALSREVLARSSAMGVGRGRLQVAVLLQPWIAFEAGGTADVEPYGGVRVTCAAGPPARLVAGRTAGAVARVTPAGVLEGDPPPNLDPGVVPEVASLARKSGGTVEWGYADGRVWLLQVGRAPAAIRPTIRAPRRVSWALPPMAARLASLATRYPGPLGDRFVLPWAPALTRVPAPDPFVVRDLRGALSEARELARVLTTRAWGSPPALAEREAADGLRSILGDDPDAGLQRLSRLRPVDPAPAARLVGLVHGLGRALAERGILSSAGLVWRLSVEELERAVSAGGRLPERRGPGRWDPFVFAVVATRGRELPGVGAAPGIGAGRLRSLGGSRPGRRAGGRDVLVVAEPVPQIASLLWNAAGLIVERGSVGAHLFEVARSLGVPAVTGVDLRGVAPRGLGAVDGDAGRAFVLTDERERADVEVGA